MKIYGKDDCMKKRMVSFIGVMTAVVLATGCGSLSGGGDFEADETVEEEVSMEQGGLTEDNSIVDTDVSADAEAEEPAAE